ncbi:MAG: hypothetical protein ABIH82_05260 [Candidatus Woesearchaeota archaeon]
MTNLGQIASNMDSARLAEKANGNLYIGCVELLGQSQIIPIPKDAYVIRTKSNKVHFYRDNPNIENGFVDIPKEAKKVQFREYEKHCHHIDYGTAIFYY